MKGLSMMLTPAVTYCLFIESTSTIVMLTNATTIYFLMQLDILMLSPLIFFRDPQWLFAKVTMSANIELVTSHWKSKESGGNAKMLAFFEAHTWSEKLQLLPGLLYCRVFGMIWLWFSFTLSFLVGYCL
jgi:hypothetical protein